MKIVIDIDDEDYKRIQGISDVFNSLTSRAYSAIRNGTPLPKGHGELIYAEDAIETLQIMFAGNEDIQNACEQCILDCPTIIEADTESEDNEDIPMEYFESGGI